MTAKKIAKILNLSEAAVSMALNNKPGVSSKTRKLVREKAIELGYDFSKKENINYIEETKKKCILLIFKASGTIFNGNAFFNILLDSIKRNAQASNVELEISYIYKTDITDSYITRLNQQKIDGFMILASEMQREDILPWKNCKIPHVFLDTVIRDIKENFILVNNTDGAFSATDYLIKHHHTIPGYLQSSYSVPNFEERANGFYQAIRHNGISTRNVINHKLTPTYDDAYEEMKQIISDNEELAKAYFADNDEIAAGAMLALKENNYKIPDDIAIIGFDNTTICRYSNPQITSVDTNISYLGKQALNRLLYIIDTKDTFTTTILINTNLSLKRSA